MILAWTYLLLAGLFEIGFTTCLKLSQNFTVWKFTIAFAVCAITSFLLLNKSIQLIPIGTAYAVWTGIGAAGTVLVGIFLFSEPADFWRVFFLSILLVGILGLKFVAPE